MVDVAQKYQGFPAKLAILMSGRYVNQSDLAKIMEVSKAAVSQWLKGIHEPDFKTLFKLSRYFQVSLYELTGSTGLRDIEDTMARVRDKKLTSRSVPLNLPHSTTASPIRVRRN